MNSILIKQATIVNEGKEFIADVFIEEGLIAQIDTNINKNVKTEINAEGLYLFPGAIDDQVHFREPGLTHKAEIFTESRAAVAGGVTSFMEMPNTNPQATNIEELEKKYRRAEEVSLANYSFFMGATNDNIEELLKVDYSKVCGIKAFLGSSTGNMLVDNLDSIESIFKSAPTIVAVHSEKEEIIRKNSETYKLKYGTEIPVEYHPEIRSIEACYQMTYEAIEIAKKHSTRLHVLHISTLQELDLFSNDIPLEQKNITSEACVHHLWFDASQYASLGNLIKCNPAIKSKEHKEAIWKALIDNKIDVVATDHAPHTLEEKQNKDYFKAPSGLPLVQHSIQLMLEMAENRGLSKSFVVDKMSHKPAKLFRVKNRGFIREGYAADLVLIKKEKYKVQQNNILYKCNWSPLLNQEFKYSIISTLVNGNIVFNNGEIIDRGIMGERLMFNN
jgi:dihydroorotase